MYSSQAGAAVLTVESMDPQSVHGNFLSNHGAAKWIGWIKEFKKSLHHTGFIYCFIFIDGSTAVLRLKRDPTAVLRLKKGSQSCSQTGMWIHGKKEKDMNQASPGN